MTRPPKPDAPDVRRKMASSKNMSPRKASKAALATTAAGLSGAIERLHAAEVEAYKSYMLAVSGTDEKLVIFRQRCWTDIVEQLRKVEKDAPQIGADKGDSYSKGDVEAGVSQICSAFRRTLLTKLRELPQELVGKTEADILETLEQAAEVALQELSAKPWES